MAIEFRLPDLGEDTTGGEVVSVLVKEGDVVEEEQPLVELETDKALLEVPSPSAGKIVKIHVEAGSKLNVGELIVTIEESGESGQAESDPDGEEETPTESDPEGKEESPAELDREKEPKEEDAPSPEKKEKTPASKSASRSSADQDESGEEETPESSDEDASEPARVVDLAEGESHSPAAPSTRRLARELGVPLSKVKGSGPGGRISTEDVKQFARDRMESKGGNQPRQGAPSDAFTLRRAA